VDESLIGGFVLEVEGKLVDASILRDLNDVKKQFANNDYIHKLR
ncbi:MAG: F0F1 ATP synthase subunit delta, partial [Ginsengibacter sp.]